MRKIITALLLTLAVLFAGAQSASATDASVITKVRQYQCGHTIKRHPCWSTVKYRVCYRYKGTHHVLGCSRWRVYATWE